MNDPAIVTLTAYPEIFEQFYRATEQYEPEARKIVVTSGQASIVAPKMCVCRHGKQYHDFTMLKATREHPRPCTADCPCMEFQPDAGEEWHQQIQANGRWRVIEGPEPFIYSRNANIGITAALEAGASGVLLVNDDVQFLRSGSLKTLVSMADAPVWDRHIPVCRDSHVGILSPQVSGIVGNKLQSYETPLLTSFLDRFPGSLPFCYSQERLCFVCVYIKREVFETIGYLDESFTGYGRDDDDFCRRAQEAGFKLAVTPDVVVLHGYQGLGCSNSYLRSLGVEEYQNATEAGNKRFLEKYGPR